MSAEEPRIMSSSTEESRAVVKGLYDAAISGDREKQLSFIDDSIVVSPPPYFPWAGPHNGKKAWQENAIPLIRGIHDTASMKIDYLADGDICIARIHMKLLGTGDEVYYQEAWTVRDGKAVAMEVFCWDPRPIQKQIDRRAAEQK
jgi:hypothetical protein